MIRATLTEIEERIRRNTALAEASKNELLGLLSSLRSQLEELSAVKGEHAESIAGFIERSAHEATRKERDPALLKLSLDGLAASVREVEQSHPRLVKEVNYISTILANMGI